MFFKLLRATTNKKTKITFTKFQKEKYPYKLEKNK